MCSKVPGAGLRAAFRYLPGGGRSSRAAVPRFTFPRVTPLAFLLTSQRRAQLSSLPVFGLFKSIFICVNYKPSSPTLFGPASISWREAAGSRVTQGDEGWGWGLRCPGCPRLHPETRGRGASSRVGRARFPRAGRLAWLPLLPRVSTRSPLRGLGLGSR